MQKTILNLNMQDKVTLKKKNQPNNQQSYQPNNQQKRTNNKKIIVQKFGGTSVNSLEKWQTISEIVKNNSDSNTLSILVCSAFSGASNALDKMIKSAISKDQAEFKIQMQQFDLLCKDFVEKIGIDFNLISKKIDKLHQLFQGLTLTEILTPALKARIMSYGEYILTAVGYEFLKGQGLKVEYLDVGNWLKCKDLNQQRYSTHADNHFLSAECDYSYDKKLQDYLLSLKADIVITQGFIATDNQDRTVLLGRGGSDTSAAYIAAKIGADQVQIWTDVPGIFTSNPKDIPSSRLILELNYAEAQELASSGASVLHPRCVEPLRSANIPLSIRWTQNPHVKHYTKITKNSKNTNCSTYVKGICRKNSVYVLSMDSVGMWMQTGFLADLFSIFKSFNISINTVSTSETNVTVTLDSSLNITESKDLKDLLEELKTICHPKLYSNCVSICLVGRNIRSILHRISSVFTAFEDKKVLCVSQAANDLNFSFIVQYKDADQILKHLHEILFSSMNQNEIFGIHWYQFLDLNKSKDNKLKPTDNKNLLKNMWWVKKSKELLNLLSTNNTSKATKKNHSPTSPIYVYNLASIKNQFNKLKSCDAVSKWFYALKANNNKLLINYINNLGLGFDCVSIQEILYLKKNLENFKAKNIIYTPNFVCVSEYQQAFELNVNVTLDNLYPLLHHPNIFKDKSIILRIDPGVAKGHHKHVQTAGNNSKFGININQLDQCLEISKKINSQIIGLHVHIGSGIDSPESWADCAYFLKDIAKNIPSISILDLGGGFSVPKKPSDKEFCFKTCNNYLQKFQQSNSHYEIWSEPGRFLVAESGVILSKVNQLKTKGNKNYIGIDAGMHTLIRPSLYNAYHPIYNLSRMDQADKMVYDVVGPICESADKLGINRLLPETYEKDIMIITNAGAYGKVMASKYNMRDYPQELVLTT